MNPYDFVRANWEQEPERHRPVWHHRFVGNEDQPLYAGHLEVDVSTETPLFIFNPRDSRVPARSMQNKQGDYIIPGSSLKGMLRCLVETLGNGCFTLFDGHYEKDRQSQEYKAVYNRKIPPDFRHCETNINLCIACRIFGMLKEGTSGVFLGKVNVSDASTNEKNVPLYKRISTITLVGPKPHHSAFYLDEKQTYIAGRKYYFHHWTDELPDTPTTSFGRKDIQPLASKVKFHFRLDFTNLEKDEFALLLLALTLEENIRHKIGYGKPMGLGSVHLLPTALTLVDYATRYTQPGGKKPALVGQDFQDLRDELVKDFSRTGLDQQAMSDLRRIWLWPPEPGVKYYYPSKRDWFDMPESHGKRIVDTRDVPG